MAQERSDTPEKQLLKLIEEPGARNITRMSAVKRRGLNLFSPGAWMGRSSFMKKGVTGWVREEGLRLLNIKMLNRTLGICNFGLVIYFALNLSNSILDLKKNADMDFTVKRAEEKNEDIKVASLLKEESYYLNKVSGRNIFKMGKLVKDDAMDESAIQLSPTVSPAVEATQHLKLVGISWSNDPDAMIEDTRALRTFFVKKGQLIGEVRVKDVLRDRIVLTYQGDDVELR